MLLTEWNWDDAKQVWHDEGVTEGIAIGEERGINIGIDKERQRSYENRLQVARNALAKGYSLEAICDLTGLDMETIASL